MRTLRSEADFLLGCTADPSSISSTRREGLLKTLLADLSEGEDGERASSTTWSHDSESSVWSSVSFRAGTNASFLGEI